MAGFDWHCHSTTTSQYYQCVATCFCSMFNLHTVNLDVLSTVVPCCVLIWYTVVPSRRVCRLTGQTILVFSTTKKLSLAFQYRTTNLLIWKFVCVHVGTCVRVRQIVVDLVWLFQMYLGPAVFIFLFFFCLHLSNWIFSSTFNCCATWHL